MPKVTIVGGGIAGLSAGLRLVERGFDVTLCEEDDFIGGKLGAHPHPDKYPEDFHEHSYHMYLNWYHNFWQIIDQIGIRDAFVAQHFFTALRRGERPVELKDARSIRDMLSDLTSGRRQCRPCTCISSR